MSEHPSSEQANATPELLPDAAPPSCRRCGASRTVPIVYGLPTLEIFEAAERGELRLGGCLVSGDDPAWHCKACGAEW